MQKKIAWFLFMALVIVFGILFYRNYQATEFPYQYTIPEGYFDDTGRKIANNNYYDAFVDFMSGNYSNHLGSLNISSSGQFKDINKKVSDFVSVSNGTGLNRLLESEEEYLGKIQQKYHQLFSTGNVFHSGEWLDIDATKVNIDQILRFPQDGTRLLQELLLVTYFDCKINPSNLCQKDQKELKSLLNITQRRGPSMFTLMHAAYLKKILYFNNLTNIIPKKQLIGYCSIYNDVNQLHKKSLIDEYNTLMFSVIGGLEDETKNPLIASMTQKKMQQIYYNAIENPNNDDYVNSITRIAENNHRAKSIFVKLGFNKTYYEADFVSNKAGILLGRVEGFKQKLQEIQTLCKPYLSQ